MPKNVPTLNIARPIRAPGAVLMALRRAFAAGRFDEIETNRPFFCGRDGVMRVDLAEIEAKRRNGDAWHGPWGESVARRYAGWSKRFPGRAPKVPEGRSINAGFLSSEHFQRRVPERGDFHGESPDPIQTDRTSTEVMPLLERLQCEDLRLSQRIDVQILRMPEVIGKPFT